MLVAALVDEPECYWPNVTIFVPDCKICLSYFFRDVHGRGNTAELGQHTKQSVASPAVYPATNWLRCRGHTLSRLVAEPGAVALMAASLSASSTVR